MTLNCDNIPVAELHIDGVVHARRNHHWMQMIPCSGDDHCGCSWDAAHPAPSGWDNILGYDWVVLPAGAHTLETRGFRFGRGGVQSQLEVAVWRSECPPVTTNVVCIPAQVIAEQGVCEFERLAALYGAMVGCVEVTANCSQGPDILQDGAECIKACEPDGCDIYPDDVATVGNPLGGQVLNTLAFNYPYEVKIHITWKTTFLQDFIGGCAGCDVPVC